MLVCQRVVRAPIHNSPVSLFWYTDACFRSLVHSRFFPIFHSLKMHWQFSWNYVRRYLLWFCFDFTVWACKLPSAYIIYFFKCLFIHLIALLKCPLEYLFTNAYTNYICMQLPKHRLSVEPETREENAYTDTSNAKITQWVNEIKTFSVA